MASFTRFRLILVETDFFKIFIQCKFAQTFRQRLSCSATKYIRMSYLTTSLLFFRKSSSLPCALPTGLDLPLVKRRCVQYLVTE